MPRDASLNAAVRAAPAAAAVAVAVTVSVAVFAFAGRRWRERRVSGLPPCRDASAGRVWTIERQVIKRSIVARRGPRQLRLRHFVGLSHGRAPTLFPSS